MAANGINLDLPSSKATKGSVAPSTLRAISKRRRVLTTYPNNIPILNGSKWKFEKRLPEPTEQDMKEIQMIRAIVEEIDNQSLDKLAAAGIARLDPTTEEDDDETKPCVFRHLPTEKRTPNASSP
jgi:hypothetical protein